VAVAASGALTIEPEDAASADPLEAALDGARDDVLAAVRAHLGGIERFLVKRPADTGTPIASRRVTHESVRSERISALRKKDPTLGAAIDALDLELMD
jgi:hypothetical protein